MPYIEKVRRPGLTYNNEPPQTKGELNFAITTLLIGYVHAKGLSYTNNSEAVAAARDAADEFLRRVGVPYEDLMIQKNGDCYQVLLKLLKNLEHKNSKLSIRKHKMAPKKGLERLKKLFKAKL